MNNPAISLSTEERDTLVACEETIDRNLRGTYEFLEALQIVHDRKLYRADYDTFDAYCRQRWDMSRQHAYAFLRQKELQDTHTESPVVGTLNQSQAVELTKIPKEAQAIILHALEAVSDDEVTASALRSMVKVCKEIDLTGYIELEGGVQKRLADFTPEEKIAFFKVAVDRETFERHQQHIARGSLTTHLQNPMLEKISISKEHLNKLRILVAKYAPEFEKKNYMQEFKTKLPIIEMEG